MCAAGTARWTPAPTRDSGSIPGPLWGASLPTWLRSSADRAVAFEATRREFDSLRGLATLATMSIDEGRFYAVTGAIAGTYEAVTLAHDRLPRLSSLAARRRSTRALAIVWAIGLAVHFARHR